MARFFTYTRFFAYGYLDGSSLLTAEIRFDLFGLQWKLV